MQESNFIRRVDKNEIPVCNILGVNIAAINMNWLLNYLEKHMKGPEGNLLSGDYICVSNVHTTVMSYEDSIYCDIQNNGLMAIPDGGPLSSIGRKHGFGNMERIAGPDLMKEIFKVSKKNNYSHFFYGSSNETLDKLKRNLLKDFPDLNIVGFYSPPFTKDIREDNKFIDTINNLKPDFIWVGLGAPKQEKWMSIHKGKISGLMIGVGAGFDYFAGNIKRAPKMLQKCNLEWLYRLYQNPKRLFMRYFNTNLKFIWHVMICGK